MTKKLTPLEAFYELGDNTPITDKWKIVETALKEHELMKEIKYTARFDLAQVNKEHKALEIIKKHKLLNYVLKNKKCANMYHLSQEDEDSLKDGLL